MTRYAISCRGGFGPSAVPPRMAGNAFQNSGLTRVAVLACGTAATTPQFTQRISTIRQRRSRTDRTAAASAEIDLLAEDLRFHRTGAFRSDMMGLGPWSRRHPRRALRCSAVSHRSTTMSLAGPRGVDVNEPGNVWAASRHASASKSRTQPGLRSTVESRGYGTIQYHPVETARFETDFEAPRSFVRGHRRATLSTLTSGAAFSPTPVRPSRLVLIFSRGSGPPVHRSSSRTGSSRQASTRSRRARRYR